MEIENGRLKLKPYHPRDLLKLIEGEESFGKQFSHPAADGLRAFIITDEVSADFVAKLNALTEVDPWQFGFAVIDRESGYVVGSAGFKGPVDAEGNVEIAYGIVPSFEGKGIATEVAGLLVEFAGQDDRVRVIRAHTLPEKNASTRVLEKNRFQFVGDVVDPEDGPVWRWQRTADRATSFESAS